jgi:ATP-dependent Clp protease ATP-binding subunit ClpC
VHSSEVLTQCPTCQGFGVTNQTAGGFMTCQTCRGMGAWLQTSDGVVLRYDLPELISTAAHENLQVKKWLRFGLAGISIAILIASFIYLLSESGFSLSDFLWTRSLMHAVFGISGLASMWAISSFEHHQTSRKSLHDLESEIDTLPLDQPLSLNDYANPRVEQVIHLAAAVAQQYNASYVDETILLITLLQQPRLIGMLLRLELSAENLLTDLKQHLAIAKNPVTGAVGVHPSMRMRLYQGLEEALNQNFPYLDLEDIFLAYTKQPGTYAALFKKHGLSYEAFYAVTRWYAEEQENARQWAFWLERGRTRPKGYMNKAWTALPTKFLDQFSFDITQEAARGNVATVTVRDAEIAQILQVLGRTQKNSVLLVGEPGVGKNSILGAVALRMIEENVPEVLKDKRLVSLDLGSLLSTGDSAVENTQQVLAEIAQAGNVILAIPEVQLLVGASGNALDAASLMANALNRGTIQLISTATYADYHRYVESNSGLKDVLDIVEIEEVSAEQAIEILEEEASVLENRQKVFLTYQAIEAAVHLAQRYLPEKVLPASALSLLDEAGSAAQGNGQKWVTKQSVEKVVETKTKIPISQASDQESEMLLHLEETLHAKIIGQEEAVQSVAKALRRARAGLHVDKRPISSFLFVGPTGVGKTETAKAVSEVFFGSTESMIRLDMSEYQDPTAVYKLIGAPAANSDSRTEGGALTTPIREHPFSLILLDELEKANSEVLNLFLQLLDDGRLTENTGRTVYYNNSIIVATSNAGAPEIMELMKAGTSRDDLSTQTMAILQKHFKPEFLNRFDAIIPFHQLRQEDIVAITKLMLQAVVEKAASQKYTIEFDDAAVAKIGQLGFDPLYGARPLRRVIQDKVEGILAQRILEKTLLPGGSLRISADMIE